MCSKNVRQNSTINANAKKYKLQSRILLSNHLDCVLLKALRQLAAFFHRDLGFLEFLDSSVVDITERVEQLVGVQVDEELELGDLLLDGGLDLINLRLEHVASLRQLTGVGEFLGKHRGSTVDDLVEVGAVLVGNFVDVLQSQGHAYTQLSHQDRT